MALEPITPVNAGKHNTPAYDMPDMAYVTASTNGTELPRRPINVSGAIIHLADGDSITFFKALTGQTFTTTHDPTLTQDGPQDYPIRISGRTSIYVTSITGTPSFSWVFMP